MLITHHTHTVADFIARGEFSSALEALGGRWPGIGVEPTRNGESDVEFGALLFACGVLTQEFGEMSLTRAQASAKDLLSRAIRLLGEDSREPDARFWLGLAYLRCGENQEALAIAEDLLSQQTAGGEVVFCAGRLKALALLNLGDAESAESALDSVGVFLSTVSPMAQGRFYLNRGMLYRQTERFDLALVDYEVAGHCFRVANSPRYEAAAENNRAGVFMEQGRLFEAHEAAGHAVALFCSLGDRAHEAKAWDQIARIYECEAKFGEMASAAECAVALLTDSDHEGWLAEALTTLGMAQAKIGLERAAEHLTRALRICERQGDPKQADSVTKALWQVVKSGKKAIKGMRQSVSPIEGVVYERLLEKHAGHVLPAAQEIGLTHQSLSRTLNNHFPELLVKRPRRWPRRKTLIRK